MDYNRWFTLGSCWSPSLTVQSTSTDTYWLSVKLSAALLINAFMKESEFGAKWQLPLALATVGDFFFLMEILLTWGKSMYHI